MEKLWFSYRTFNPFIAFNLKHLSNFLKFLFRDFAWSPADNILSYWVPEEKENPARVTLIDIPSRKELRVKNLFNVAECKLHWQKQGDYMCCKVDRYTKSKKVRG